MSPVVIKAGGIIVDPRDDTDYLVLIYRDNLADWSFPKGGIKDWELAQEAALRKAKEETGLEVEVVKRLPNLNYDYADGTPCTVNFYLMKPLSQEFSPNKDITQAKWFPIETVRRILTGGYLKDYFDTLIKEGFLSY